jgi:hypothetical protein
MPDPTRPAFKSAANPCNAMQPPTAFDETNPIFEADPLPTERFRDVIALATRAALASTAPTPFPACDAMQPGATQCAAVQPKLRSCETNPNPPAAGFAASTASDPAATGRPGTPLTADAQGARTASLPCDAVQPGATSCDVMQPNAPRRRTNPNGEAELDHRRLAAIRLLAAGRSVPAAATELRLSRSTLWRWQREAAFRAELRRVHERMTTPAPRPPVPIAPPPPPDRPALSSRDLAFLRNALRSNVPLPKVGPRAV